MIKPSERLLALAKLLPDSMNAFYDVGSDHCYLPLYLLQKGRAREAFAIDIHPMPLKKAKRKLEGQPKLEALHFVVNDGLKGLNLLPAASILIAGLGGNEILKILTEVELPLGQEVLVQVNWHWQVLRSGLQQIKFSILDEWVVVERNKPYFVLKLRRDDNSKSLSYLEAFAGPVLLEKFKKEPREASLLLGFQQLLHVQQKRALSREPREHMLLEALSEVINGVEKG